MVEITKNKIHCIIELAKKYNFNDNKFVSLDELIPNTFDEIESFNNSSEMMSLPSFLLSLSPRELSEVFAIMLIGRGDSSDSFDNIVARENTPDNHKRIGYLTGKSKLAEYLEKGASALMIYNN